jgi:hypothetical protein
MQVLEHLPYSLAIAVLSASQANLHRKLSVLPASLYPLAIDAAIPSIRQQHSLTLDFSPFLLGDPTMAVAAMYAATTATISLKRVDLRCIPLQNRERLLQLIPASCKSALHVSLEYGHYLDREVPEMQHIEQLGEVLSHNAGLTHLKLTINGQAQQGFHLEGLTD